LPIDDIGRGRETDPLETDYAYYDQDHKDYQQIGIPPVLGLAIAGTLNHDPEAAYPIAKWDQGARERFDGAKIFAIEELPVGRGSSLRNLRAASTIAVSSDIIASMSPPDSSVASMAAVLAAPTIDCNMPSGSATRSAKRPRRSESTMRIASTLASNSLTGSTQRGISMMAYSCFEILAA
jgi:hypothetical protein